MGVCTIRAEIFTRVTYFRGIKINLGVVLGKKEIKSILEKVFTQIEDYFLSKKVLSEKPFIFIISPPRTGSTLLYQLITRCFKVCYFNNFMMRFPHAPIFISKISVLLKGCDPPDCFDSYYGEISGWKSPSQGYKVWNRWFPVDQCYVDIDGITNDMAKEISNTVCHISNSFNMPFVNKWPGNSVRILPLNYAIPNLLFLRITRNPLYVTNSIMDATKKYLSDDKQWFSTKPKEYNFVKDKPLLERTCEQVYFLEKNIDADIEKVGHEKCFNIEYSDLCKNPVKILNQIAQFIEKTHNFRLAKRHDVPNKFKIDGALVESSEISNKIKAYFLKLQKTNGSISCWEQFDYSAHKN